MFSIFEGSDKHIRCKDVDPIGSMLHSWQTFVVFNDKSIYIWKGKASLQSEIDSSKILVENIKSMKPDLPNAETFLEGKESQEFWELIGGKCGHFVCPASQIESRPRIKMFEVSSGTGVVDVEPIFDVCQESLNHQRIMIIDVGDCIWVWFGIGARQLEEKLALDTAIKYAEKAPHLPKQCDIKLTKSFQEPPTFKDLFHGWADFKKGLEHQKITGVDLRDARQSFKDYIQEVYSYHALTQNTLPKGVDSTKKRDLLI